MAQWYAISGEGEARAYLNHPVLGSRYRTCVSALQDLGGSDAEQVFGGTDSLKLRSSLTLFAEVSDEALIRAALERWFRGHGDPATLRLLGRNDH